MAFPVQSRTVHVEQLGEELCLYDWSRKTVHALNPTAALVWRRCDGTTDSATIAAALEAGLGVTNAEEVVAHTLRDLARADLVAWPDPSAAVRPTVTRRAL